MISTNLKDKDGFRLQFEEDTDDTEREFYMKLFPTVDLVAKKKLHCTVCDIHIGTAPLAEKIIRSHPILNVTHCNKCFAFYNSGEFGKGEDGSEYYCRWCGQGGEVYCCSKCPFVFCSKCIKLNLSSELVDEIESNEDWPCFVCAPKAIWHLKAQHWALQNYIEKQTQQIKDMNLISEGEINFLLSKDSSTCCPKRKSIEAKKITQSTKRKSTTTIQTPAPKKPAPVTKPIVNGNSPSTEKKNDEVVCTPDIFSLFEQDDNQNAQAASATAQKSGGIRPMRITATPSVPPPLAIRQTPGMPRVRLAQPVLARGQQATVQTGTQSPNPVSPVYHTIGGYRIDLNHAARQEIFRLPNGKLIQVRKQVTGNSNNATTTPAPAAPPIPVGMPQRAVIRPNVLNRTGAVRPNMATRMQRPAAPTQGLQTRFLISDATPSQITASQVNSLTAIVTPATPTTPAQVAQNGTTVFQQQNGSIVVNRAQHPNNEFGKAKTSFEDKIISGMEICQHTINKMITLTNSTSFKTSRNFQDLKELYIHLKYLYSFTIGKFNTLQEKLAEDMEKLAENDPGLNKADDDDDDLEIVEKQHECIEVDDSDDDESSKISTPGSAKKKTPRKQTLQPKSVPDTPDKAEIATAIEEIQNQNEASNVAEEVTSSRASSPSKSVSSEEPNLEDDAKLQKEVVVKAEKLEERFPFVNEYLNEMKESNSESIRVRLPPVGDEDCSIIEEKSAETSDPESESESENKSQEKLDSPSSVNENVLENGKTAEESEEKMETDGAEKENEIVEASAEKNVIPESESLVDNVSATDEKNEDMPVSPVVEDKIEDPAVAENKNEESTNLDIHLNLENHDKMPEVADLLAENGLADVNDFDPDELLNSVGNDHTDLPEFPDLDDHDEDQEKIQQQVSELSEKLLDATPMEAE